MCKAIGSSKNRINKTGEEKINRVITERWLGARERSKKKDLEFLITKEDLLNILKQQKYKCALSNMFLTFELGKGRVSTNISIDRKDSKQGYTKENIQLVCMAVNQMKNDLSLEELLIFCSNILNYYKNENKN